MKVGLAGGDAAARGALDEALLEQIRLVDVLERVLLLGDDDREGRQAYGAAVELLDDRAEDLAVEAVEAFVVDFHEVEGGGGDLRVDGARVADLGEVPDAL